jgi:hypothetical protein
MNINERRLRKLFGAHGFRVREIRNNKHWVATVERNSGGRSSTWLWRDRQAMVASLGNSSRHFDVPSARPHLDNTTAPGG